MTEINIDSYCIPTQGIICPLCNSINESCPMPFADKEAYGCRICGKFHNSIKPIAVQMSLKKRGLKVVDVKE